MPRLQQVDATEIEVDRRTARLPLRHQQIGHATGPAVDAVAAGIARHPQATLVAVRKELRRQLSAARLIFRRRHRPDQIAAVGRHGESTAVVERRQLAGLWVESMGRAIERHKLGLWYRQVATRCGVVRVAGAVGRHDHVEAVVSPGKIDTDQRLVVIGRRGQSAARVEQRAAEREANAVAEKFTSVHLSFHRHLHSLLNAARHIRRKR